MKVLLLGAGASKCAGYPLTKDLMQAIGQEAIDSRALHLKDAWNKWKHLRETAPDRLSLMLNSPNPEICLSLLDLYELALAEQDPHKPSVYVETRNGLLECLRWFFAWKHAQGNTNELTREYLRSKLRSLSRGDVVITLNWDTTVERTLLEEGRWTPTTGYGFRKRLRAGFFRDSLQPLPVDTPKTEVRVLKLHGSVGWYSVDGGPLYFDHDEFLSVLPFPSATLPAFDPQQPPLPQAIYQRSLMAYPSFLKKLRGPEMQRVWSLASRALSSANAIEVWGYSLPSSDVAVRALLNPLRFRLARGKLRVEVHDPDPTGQVHERWREFLGSGTGLELLDDSLR